jgi:lysozyme
LSKLSLNESERQALREQLKKHEGTGPVKNGRFFPYKDSVGKLTIGYGRNLEDRGLSLAEAEFLLNNDIDDHGEELVEKLPWVTTLSFPRLSVLLDMAFNMGLPTLLTFKRTLSLIRFGDFQGASITMLASKWATQVKGRALTLSNIMRTDINPFLKEKK